MFSPCIQGIVSFLTRSDKSVKFDGVKLLSPPRQPYFYANVAALIIAAYNTQTDFCPSKTLQILTEPNMELVATDVGLLRCARYEREKIVEQVDRLCSAVGFPVSRGSRVLLKPNLVSAMRNVNISCTHAEFVAAVAQWFIDHRAVVTVGDSPAFGTAQGVMSACGISDALHGLPVRLINFNRPRSVQVGGWLTLKLDRALDECDQLINLPKIKAHGQLLVTLAVKNYFGTVVGFQKPWLHAKHGDVGNRFERLLVDLLAEMPSGISLVDGIEAMHQNGPTTGVPYKLGIIAGGLNPVAIDAALYQLLGVDSLRSPLARECQKRGLETAFAQNLNYPLLAPEELRVHDFMVPNTLNPVSFHPWRLFVGAVKRLRMRYLNQA